MHPFALMHTRLALPLLAASLLLPLAAQGQDADRPPGHLRLIDPLDRPADGYCLDVVGSGRHIRFDLPLTAHNCKPGLYADEAVVHERNGYLRFPAYEACATVAGLDGRALPGAAVVPRACGERTPFMEADRLQRFVHRKDGRVELEGSGLCLTVGRESASTFEPTHRWRPLYVERCDDSDPARSRWEFAVPAARAGQ